MNQKTSLQPIDVFRNQTLNAAEKFRFALPKHIPVEKFIGVLNTAVASNQELLQMHRQSLFIAATKCAGDGLLPDGREAVLLPFKGAVTYIPMVLGLIQKAYRSGEVASIRAHVVCANDHFELQYGDDEFLEHTPNMEDRGEPRFAYAIAILKSGEILREVLSREDIAKIRNMSRAKSGPWIDWEEQMWEKTAIRRLAKRLPTSVAIHTQGDDEEGFKEPDVQLTAAPEEPKRRGRPPKQIEGPAEEPADHDPETGETPLTPEEYETSRLAMAFETTDGEMLDKIWKAEKTLRNKLNLTPDQRDKIFAVFQDRIRELAKEPESP
jgi:recombination protein RecT